MEYKIIQAGSIKELEKIINKEYREYRPSGGITIKFNRLGFFVYMQVIYKEK